MFSIIHATSLEEKELAFDVRKKVFVDEQNVPEEEELDVFDETSDHFVLFDGNSPIGAGRFRSADGIGKFERICVLSSHRGKGAGEMIMKEIESFARINGFKQLKLNAQTHALSFYEKLGYHITSDEFLDAGIPHKTMQKTI